MLLCSLAKLFQVNAELVMEIIRDCEKLFGFYGQSECNVEHKMH